MAGEWRFRSWFISQLRNISRKYPPHYRAENAVKEVYYIETKTGKKLRRVRFTCASCGKKVDKKQIRRDHIDPVVDPTVGFPIVKETGEDDWNAYLKRMLVSEDKIQMICKPCHEIKSKEENKTRRDTKNKVDKS